MGRTPCCDKQGLKKGPWTPEEDKILVDFIQANGHGSWRSLPKVAGLLRCGKSCRLRWTNYLRPDIKRGPFTPDEQKSIIQLHGIVGNKWSTIAAQLPGRTDNEIKNFWNTHLKKKLLRMGIHPDTYTPTSPAATAAATSAATATRHMAQWESARLEAEARLSRESLLFSPLAAASMAALQADDSGHSHNNNNSSSSNCSSVRRPRPEPDVFLRMWHSDAGARFRKATSFADGGEEEEGEESASTAVTASEVEDGKALAGDGSEVDESYQMYLDFADELGLLPAGPTRIELGSCFSPPFSGDDLNVASLDADFK